MKRIVAVIALLLVLGAIGHAYIDKARYWASTDYYQNIHNGYQFASADRVRQVFY